MVFCWTGEFCVALEMGFFSLKEYKLLEGLDDLIENFLFLDFFLFVRKIEILF